MNNLFVFEKAAARDRGSGLGRSRRLEASRSSEKNLMTVEKTRAPERCAEIAEVRLEQHERDEVDDNGYRDHRVERGPAVRHSAYRQGHAPVMPDERWLTMKLNWTATASAIR